MNYHGVEFENRAEVLRRYFINPNSSISAVMRKYDISESDALDYTILRRKYSLEYYGYYKDIVFISVNVRTVLSHLYLQLIWL